MSWSDESSGFKAAPWADDKEHLIAAVRFGAATIGAWFRARRLARGWTQAELAWRSRVSQPTISRLETGHLKCLMFSRFALISAVLDGVEVPTLEERPRRPRRGLPDGRRRY
jgi:DNA-binding XRE family transcriptional regulator